MELKFPWLRDHLIEYLRELADPERQRKEWAPGLGSLDHIVHFLFDDTPPQDSVGAYLHSLEEEEAVCKVQLALDRILDKYGTSLQDWEYTQVPEWQSVILAAREALDELARAS